MRHLTQGLATCAMALTFAFILTATAKDKPMKYMLLIYGAENGGPEFGTPEFDAYMGEYQAVTDDVTKAGKLLASEALQPTSTATAVRVRKGNIQKMDGPFAETKEQLGGFYLLECKDLDEAIAYAARIPDARTGTVEVRPIMTFE